MYTHTYIYIHIATAGYEHRPCPNMPSGCGASPLLRRKDPAAAWTNKFH